MNILVVDDDPISIRMLQHTLSDAGHVVDVAFDGESALQRLRRGDIRIVISDWDMPGLSGEELCKAVRGPEFKRYIYFILLSGGSGDHDVVSGLSAGADDYIKKPFNPAELVMRVRAAARIVGMETLDMTIFAMAKLAEMRDTETGRHVERVALYSRALARQLAKYPKFAGVVDADYINLVYQTAPLHDIGKVAIPDAILMKSMPLSPEEFALMKTHTTLGSNTLDAAIREYPDTPFLLMARDIAATHHERWDGSGYPKSLSQNQIPLCGRIVAVADVYDAMTSSRPYKQAFDHQRVKQIIVESAGSHFDPDIVDAFLAAEIEFLRILNEFGERHPHGVSSMVA
jgi:putative two-component system response regulator